MDKKKVKRTLMRAAKIAMGSSAAIYLATMLQLDYATSAGSIALLTIVTTKWETVKLSVARLVTFVIVVLLGMLIFLHLSSAWMSYGIYVFFIVIICEWLGWKATISVNAVIGTHFLTTTDFSPHFILNEFYLVFIGITIALILNLFYDYRSQKSEIIKNMRYTEERLQMILGAVAAYLSGREMQIDVWEKLNEIEEQLKSYILDACDYQNNTFHSHPGYYINYFEMRMQQVEILITLHEEMAKIRTVPRQAHIIAEYIFYLIDYVVEMNVPTMQIERLRQIFADMKEEPLPVTREEFENRALLFHILLDLEEFLYMKKHFVEKLDEKQLKLYWSKK